MSYVIIAGVLVVVAAVVIAWVIRRARGPRIGEVAPADVLQRKYKLYAENRPIIRLNPDRVPPQLRDLIPLAEKWGIGDDIIRVDFEKKASDAERRELLDALRDRYDQINQWLDAADPNTRLTDEMAAFMHMAEASEEVTVGP